MLSNDMYDVLKCIPRSPQQTTYNDIRALSGLETDSLISILSNARYHTYDYINAGIRLEPDDPISLTEKGQAAIEEYEAAKRNDGYVLASAKSAQDASKAAKWSIIIACVALIISILQLLK